MALTLANAIDEVRYILNETYEGFTELMPNQVDRDFSAASAWANVDVNAYNETGDLTMTANAADQYCTLAVASAPTTVGRRYRLFYDLSSIASTWTVQNYTGAHTIGTISANATQGYLEFIARTTGGLRLVAGGTTSSGNFDNFSLKDVTDGFWTDAEITAWIKEGTRVFSSKSLSAEAIGTIDPMKVSTPYYDSADETFIGAIMEIYSIIYFDGTATYKGLVKIHPRQIGNVPLKTTGPPKYFCLFNRLLYVFPLANATVAAAGTLDVLYAQETDDITAIADEYQHLPIQYAIAKAKEKDQKFGEASSLFTKFYQEVAFERADKHDRPQDTLDNFKIKSGRETNAR